MHASWCATGTLCESPVLCSNMARHGPGCIGGKREAQITGPLRLKPCWDAFGFWGVDKRRGIEYHYGLKKIIISA